MKPWIEVTYDLQLSALSGVDIDPLRGSLWKEAGPAPDLVRVAKACATEHWVMALRNQAPSA